MSLCSLDGICNYHLCRHSITSDERVTELPCLSDRDAFLLDIWHAAVSMLISFTTFSALLLAPSSVSVSNPNATAALPGELQRTQLRGSLCWSLTQAAWDHIALAQQLTVMEVGPACAGRLRSQHCPWEPSKVHEQ